MKLKAANLSHRFEGELEIFANSNHDMILIYTDMIYLLTAIGLTPGSSSTVHIYTQTVHRTTQLAAFVGKLSGI
jgi:uncharacterized integral membrane protein